VNINDKHNFFRMIYTETHYLKKALFFLLYMDVRMDKRLRRKDNLFGGDEKVL